MITLLLSFTACYLDYEPPSRGSYVIDRTRLLEEEAASAELTPMEESEAPRTLSVLPEGATGGYIEVRPWRMGEDGTPIAGEALSLTKATGPMVQVALPPRGPMTHDTEAPAVVYSIALRAMDAGRPGAYTGISETDVVFIREPGLYPGSKAGWNLVAGWGEESPVFGDLADGVNLHPSLQGNHGLHIAGWMGVDAPEGTHIGLVSQTNAGIAQAYDSPVSDEWRIDIEGGPRPEVLNRTETYEGARFSLYAYADDGDHRWSGEPLVARACTRAADAVVTWYAAPLDLPHALTLRHMGVRAGWDVLLYTADGEEQLSPDEYSSLVFSDNCG